MNKYNDQTSDQYGAFFMLAWDMRHESHTVWAKIQNKSIYEAKRRKWFPRDFTPKRSNDACDTRDFTLWCSNDAWIKSSRLRASIKKLCSLSSLAILFDVHSYCLYTLFSVQDHWIKTFSFSCSDGRIQGEHMTICVNYCIQGWISVVRTDI